MKSLREAFAEIQDYRANPRYPLEGILCLVCLAMLCLGAAAGRGGAGTVGAAGVHPPPDAEVWHDTAPAAAAG